MGKLVRLWRGEWFKDNTGAWNFHADPANFGFGAMIRDNETYESLLDTVRMRYVVGYGTPVVISYQFPSWILGPLGRRSVPISITTTTDIPVMLSVREWFTELILVVTIGAEAVARFHFNRRDNFDVGRRRFVVDGSQNAFHRLDYERLVVGRRMKCNLDVLREIFNEQGMMVLHRVDLEMDLADAVQRQNERRYEAIAREIIEIEEEDDDMAEAQHEVVSVAEAGGVEQAPTTVTPEIDLTQEIDGLQATDEIAPAENTTAPVRTMETAMEFWEALMGDEEVKDAEGGVDSEAPTEEAAHVTGANGLPTEATAVVDDKEVSSTGSCEELDVVVAASAHVEARPTMEKEANVTENGNDLLTAFERFMATREKDAMMLAREGEQSQHPVTERDSSKGKGIANSPPPLGFTIGCVGKADDTGDKEMHTPTIKSSSDGSGDDGFVGSQDKELYVGRIFKNREEFKQHMALYAITNKFVYRCARSSPSVMSLECCGEDCQWRVYAGIVKGSEMYEVRKMGGTHSCSVDERSGYQKQATSSVIGELLKQQFTGTGVGPRPKDIRQVMRGDHAVNISYWKAWRSRETAVDIAKGSCGSSYQNLPTYLQRLVESNPGTIAKLDTEYIEGFGHRFKYMFVAMGACVKGFGFMRKVVVIDGTHLRGKYAGCLLTASAQDGNYQIYPLAFAVVDGENDKSWELFFEKLSTFVPNDKDVVFVSDRHASILKGLKKVYPAAGHGACIIHLKRNIRTIFKQRQLGYLVSKAARSFRVGEFNTVFTEIVSINKECADYLLGIGLEEWTRSHFQGDRYNIMTSNLAESWNSVLREAREYPIVALVEFIRAKIMSWFAERRDSMKGMDAGLTPKVSSLLSANFEICGGYAVRKVDLNEYEVQDLKGASFVVSLSDKKCSCFEFQKLRIPCPHGIAAALSAKVGVERLVDEVYTIKYLKEAYNNHILPPVDLDDTYQLASGVAELFLNPPATRRPPGRPRKKRFFSRGEIRMKKVGRRYCSRCKGMGHNRATCKEAI